MTINDISTGTEGAQNSSTRDKATIQTRDDAPKRQTHYRAAIAEFIGCSKLTRRITEVRDEAEYAFDFRHDECGRVFKVFSSGNLGEYEKYARYPGNVVIIVDVEDHPGCEKDEEACGDDMTVFLPSGFAERLGTPGVAYVYYRGYLCEENGELDGGNSVWDSFKIRPVCGLEEDDED